MKLSIITINRNNKDGLQKTIESVVAQTFSDFEYIVIDGASTDGSVEVIEKYTDKITYWISEPDNGIYNAMNKGILQAKGEYCLFLNSGDYLVDKFILEKVFKENHVEDIVYGFYSLISQNFKVQKCPDKWNFRLFLDETLPHPASFIKRSLFYEIAFYNEANKVISDWEFFVLAIIIHKKSYKQIPLCITNYEGGGISSTGKFLNSERLNVLRTSLKDILPQTVLDLHEEVSLYKKSKVIAIYDLLLKNRFLLRIYNFVFHGK